MNITRLRLWIAKGVLCAAVVICITTAIILIVGTLLTRYVVPMSYVALIFYIVAWYLLLREFCHTVGRRILSYRSRKCSDGNF